MRDEAPAKELRFPTPAGRQGDDAEAAVLAAVLQSFELEDRFSPSRARRRIDELGLPWIAAAAKAGLQVKVISDAPDQEVQRAAQISPSPSPWSTTSPCAPGVSIPTTESSASKVTTTERGLTARTWPSPFVLSRR